MDIILTVLADIFHGCESVDVKRFHRAGVNGILYEKEGCIIRKDYTYTPTAKLISDWKKANMQVEPHTN